MLESIKGNLCNGKEIGFEFCLCCFVFIYNIYCWLESIMGDVCSGWHLGSTKPGLGTHPPRQQAPSDFP